MNIENIYLENLIKTLPSPPETKEDWLGILKILYNQLTTRKIKNTSGVVSLTAETHSQILRTWTDIEYIIGREVTLLELQNL